MEIYVQPDRLKNASSEFRELAWKIQNVENSVNYIANSLDWNVKSKATVNNALNDIKKRLNRYENALTSYSSFLTDAANTYNQLDTQGRSDSDSLKNNLYQGGQSGSSDSRPGNTNHSKPNENPGNANHSKPSDNPGNTNHSKPSDNHGNNSNAGQKPSDKSDYEKFVEGILNQYVRELLSQYSKYYTGLKLYSYAAEFALFGTVLDFIFKPVNLLNTYKNGVSSWSVFSLDVTKTTVSLFKSISTLGFKVDDALKIQKKLEVIQKASTLSKAGKTVTNASIFREALDYVPIINVGLDFAKQNVKSYNKYKENGIDAGEAGAMGIESSIKGLFGVTEGLLGPFGIPLSAADSAFGLSDKVSAGIENWAAEAGRSMTPNGVSSKKGAEGVIITGLYRVGEFSTAVYNTGKRAADMLIGMKNGYKAAKSFFR